MKQWLSPVRLFLLGAFLSCGFLLAQSPARLQTVAGPAQEGQPINADLNPVPLEWVPPALLDLQSRAALKENFTFDRAMLEAATNLVYSNDADLRQSVNKLDGVSVHLLRFGPNALADPAEVDAVRDAYHLRGWKHLITTTNKGGPVHNESADVWVVMDGANMRGAVVLDETPQSLTLVTVAGNLSPIDLLHLRGHFGIPRFDGDGLDRHHAHDQR